jgi:hypothetical protein
MQINEINTQADNCAAALTLTAIDCRNASVVGTTLAVTVATPAVKTFVDADVTVATDLITIASHGFATGLKVAATTGGTLPAGLSATNYWVIKVSSSTFKLASSAANALVGTVVDITAAAGGGTHTLTPASITGGSYKTQVSIDGTTYVDLVTHDLLPVGQNITVTNSWYWDWDKPAFNYFRIVFACTTGQFAYSLVSTTKE